MDYIDLVITPFFVGSIYEIIYDIIYGIIYIYNMLSFWLYYIPYFSMTSNTLSTINDHPACASIFEYIKYI